MVKIKKIENNADMLHAFEVRNEVFVIEQEVNPALEYDEFEKTSHHYLALQNDKPIGTARWRETEEGVKLERFAVLKDFRGSGAGNALLKNILDDVEKIAPNKIYLHAQVQVIPFYEKAGFDCIGPEFIEADIRHRKMVLKSKE